MPTCEKHKTVFKHECSECLHERSREEIAEQKAAEKAEKTLKKAKLKQQQPRPKPKVVSDKRKELNNEYARLAEQFKLDNPNCAVRLPDCTGSTEDVHHRRGRGKYLLEISTWVPVCRNCHIYIENHPEESIQRGWSESRLAIDQTKPTI